jgi:hypothetical protein
VRRVVGLTARHAAASVDCDERDPPIDISRVELQLHGLRDAPRRGLHQLRREDRGADPRVRPRRARRGAVLRRLPRGDRTVLLHAARTLARATQATWAVMSLAGTPRLRGATDADRARGRPYGLRNANLTYAIDKYTKKTIQTTSTTNTTPRGHTRWNGFSRGAAGLPTAVGATLGSGGCRSAPRLAGRSVDCR